MAASAGTPAAAKGAQSAARILALTGIDILTDEALLKDAQAEFQRLTDGQPYRSPIPADQKPPTPGG